MNRHFKNVVIIFGLLASIATIYGVFIKKNDQASGASVNGRGTIINKSEIIANGNGEIVIGEKTVINNYNSNSDLSIEVSSLFLESDELEYYDCVQAASGKSGFEGNWEKCKNKRPRQRWIDLYWLYNDCKSGLKFSRLRGQFVGLEKNCEQYKPVEYKGQGYSSFLRIKNKGTTPIYNLTAKLIISDGISSSYGEFKVPFALNGQIEASKIFSKQKIFTKWEPKFSALCISGNNNQAPTKWVLYTGEPWQVVIDENLVEFLYGHVGLPTPLFLSYYSGSGSDLNECLSLAKEQLSNFMKK
jgi:hypothetical protein